MSYNERKQMAAIVETIEFAIWNKKQIPLDILADILIRLRQLQPEKARAA